MAGRPLKISWTESGKELADRLEKERDPRRKSRLQALLMLREGERISDVSDAVGADYRTILHWVAWYRSGGLEEVLRRTLGHGATGRFAKLTPDQTAALLRAHEDGQVRTIQEAIEWTAEHYGVTYTYPGMYALLRRARARAAAE